MGTYVRIIIPSEMTRAPGSERDRRETVRKFLIEAGELLEKVVDTLVSDESKPDPLASNGDSITKTSKPQKYNGFVDNIKELAHNRV